MKKLLKEGGDHEVAMAQSSLQAIIEAAQELMAKIGSNERNIPGWIQNHVTNAENYIEQAAQGFHELEHEQPEKISLVNMMKELNEPEGSKTVQQSTNQPVDTPEQFFSKYANTKISSSQFKIFFTDLIKVLPAMTPKLDGAEVNLIKNAMVNIIQKAKEGSIGSKGNAITTKIDQTIGQGQ